MPEDRAELSFEEFVRARKACRRQAQADSGDATSPQSQASSPAQDGGDFLLYSAGPRGLFAVFEDFERSGWFYLYDAQQRKILKSARIYDRENVLVQEEVVDIGWAANDSACGLALWGEFRAFFALSGDVELHKPMHDSEERGIPAEKWPPGFEHYLEKKVD